VYGGDYIVEAQIDPGTEGIIFFSQRCIDAWNDTGGVANIPILRFHDFSDAYFLPGLRSQPNVVSGHANNGIRLRNKDGTKYIWLKNDGTADITVDTLNITADIIHNGNNTQTGTYNLTGSMVSTESITAETMIANVDITWGPLGTSGVGHTHAAGSYAVMGTPVTGDSGVGT
jgi:hypothetical protein